MKRAEKREHLIDVAAALFNRHGYHAAGVDRVIEEAGIAKTTLYRHFKSKEDLIVAVLRRADQKFRDDMRRVVEASGADPVGRLLATFDYLATWFGQDSFYGCPFVGAAGEYGDRRGPVFQEVAMHKRLVVAYFEELAHAAGFAAPGDVAQEINLLHEGATAVAHVTGEVAPAVAAKSLAARFLKDAERAAA
jgi:AcrR family transcriptional regulator